VQGAAANALAGALPEAVREERRARFMAVAEAASVQRLERRIGVQMQVLVDAAPAMGRKGGTGRTYADAPEIDGLVRLLPPAKASKQLKVGSFTQARVMATDGHDLIAEPI
jgi:ribosomal protein S12 methylthiotransferase